jgi:hypothetical protein
MDENFFAAHSANPKWTKTSSRRTLQIRNGRKLLRGALCKSEMDAKSPKWPPTALRHAEIPVQPSQILIAGGVTVRNSSSESPLLPV